MNTKKVWAILISVAFVIVAVVCFISALVVKDINVTFAVSESTDCESVQSALEDNLGKNYLFLNENDIKKSLEGNHYLEVLSVDKQFPNVVNVCIKERREVYYIEYQGKTFVTDENGFVLKQGEPSGQIREKIKLSIGEGITLDSIEPGKVIKTDNDELLSLVFDIAKSVNLTDCIESILIERSFAEVDEYDVVFNAYTGVQLRVLKVMKEGKQKAQNAFNAYDNLTDYQKYSGEIMSFIMDDGRHRVNYNDGVHVIPVGP